MSENRVPIVPFDEVGLDPLYWAYLKLFASDIHSLVVDTQSLSSSSSSSSSSFSPPLGTVNLFFIECSKRVVNKVEVLGIIVNKNIERRRVLYAVDDGTGLLQVAWLFKSGADDSQAEFDSPQSNFMIGQKVVVRGPLTKFGDYPIEIKIETIDHSIDPNEEILHWCTAAHLSSTTYRSPLVFGGAVAEKIAEWKEKKRTTQRE